MSERAKKFGERSSTRDAETSSPPQQTRDAGRPSTSAAGLDQDIESILDEIDDVLEANAEDFVRNYVQKGGE